MGTPREVPGNLFVAQFIGSPKMNVLPVGTEGLTVPGITPEGAGQIGIRPEHITPVAPGAGQIDGTVDLTEYLGADTFLIVDCGAAGKLTVRVHGDSRLKAGAPCGLSFGSENCHFFGSDGRAIRA